MKYMFLIYSDENDWTEEERNACLTASMKICDELQSQGKLIDASPLESVKEAKSVRVSHEAIQITDGPFAETTEQLGGYYLIEVNDLDEAISIASRLPPARKGTVEIRPLLPLQDSMSLPEPDIRRHDESSVGQRTDYLLLMYAPPGAWPPEEHATALAESVELCHHLHADDQFVSAAPLQPTELATCVRVRDDQRIIVDGPFAETKEQLGGFFLIRVKSMDEAVEIATRIPGSRRGTAEVRPLFQIGKAN